MNIKYILVVLLCFILCSCNKFAKVDIKETQEKKDGLIYLINSEEPFTGDISEEFYVNDGHLLKKKYHVKNGMYDGIQKEYYDNGQLKSEMNYKNGSLENIQKEYFDNGRLKIEKNYKNNKLNGQLIVYKEDGTIQSSTYYKNGCKLDN